MATSTNVPWFVRIARILFFANAAIWLAFGVAALVEADSANPASGYQDAALMLVNAAAMLAAGIGIGRQGRLFFFFAMLVLAINLFLSLADQFGIYDIVTLLISGFLLGLLLATREHYLEQK